jgi:site-specific DNA-cytosine methylase
MLSLDLFSCLGCHAVGFARAGIETVAFCEIRLRRHLVIADNFPDRPIYKDVRTFNGRPADIVIGGPPCQETSVAAAIHGRRSGQSLWPDMLRIGLNVGAEWFVVEQPPGHAAWETKVSDDLCRNGRHVARFEFGASDFGAPYLRRRVFLVACTSLPRLEIAWQALPSEIEGVKRAADARGDWDPGKLRTLRVDARSAGEMVRARSVSRRERIEALGDSNPPHMAEAIGRAILRAAA